MNFKEFDLNLIEKLKINKEETLEIQLYQILQLDTNNQSKIYTKASFVKLISKEMIKSIFKISTLKKLKLVNFNCILPN